jgi:glycosyltransferase involved in cell wall biosynthesis
MKISAIIITLNEEKKLASCLESLSGIADEIVVVDSGSTDGTESVARRFTDKFYFNKWPGYAIQKNLAAEKASSDWVLSLDADERLSDQLKQSIALIETANESVSAYRFPRKTFYLGRWIEHSGWYPDRKPRLYDRRKARWGGDFVHESLLIDGDIQELTGDLLHYSIDSVFDHAKTANRYTQLAAEEWNAKGRKARFIQLSLLPPVTFFKSYVLQGGFRDGVPGLCIATFASYYVFMKYMKLWEAQNVSCMKDDSGSNRH